MSCLIVLILLAWPAAVWGQARGGAAEREIRALVERFGQAFVAADVAALTPLLTEDYVHTNAGGSVLSKPQWLAYVATRKAELQARLVIDVYANDDLTVRFYGVAAVVTGRNVARGKRDGREFTTRLRFTHVWVKRNGRWQRAAFHDSVSPP